MPHAFPESTTGRYTPGAGGRTITQANIQLALKSGELTADDTAASIALKFSGRDSRRHAARAARLIHKGS